LSKEAGVLREMSPHDIDWHSTSSKIVDNFWLKLIANSNLLVQNQAEIGSTEEQAMEE